MGCAGSGPRLVFLITVDCLRADHVSGNGYPVPTTPALDELAAEGVGFPRAYSTAGHTAMSFPGLLLSNYFQNFGRSRIVPAHLTTLAQALAGHGFRTVAINAGNVQISHFYGYDRGFGEFHDFIDEQSRDADSFEMSMRPDDADVQAILDDCRARPEVLAMIEELTGLRGESLAEHLSEHRRFYPCDATEAVRRAITGIENAPAEADQFYWLHLMDVHEDITVPAAPYCTLGPAGQLLLNLCADSPAGRVALARDPRPYVSLYDAAVRHVDSTLALLHAFLAQTGRLERALVCVTADHGQSLFEKGVFGHCFSRLSEELVHVPLVFGGGLAQGLRGCDAERAVSTLDVAPTILDLCGVDRPESFLGRSLRDGMPRPVHGQSFYNGARNRTADDSAWRFYLQPFPRPIKEWGAELIYSIEDGWQMVYDARRDAAQMCPLRSCPPTARPDPAAMKERLLDYFARAYAVPEQSEAAGLSPDDRQTVAARLEHLGYL
jgi:arylsulfatase A-like enzyme